MFSKTLVLKILLSITVDKGLAMMMRELLQVRCLGWIET